MSRSAMFIVLISLATGWLAAGNGEDAAAADAAQIEKQWQGSPHADRESEAFRHWDEEGEIPAACATCHSMTGFQDYTGADGSAVSSTEQPVHPDTVIGCQSCHHDAVGELTSIPFPSGASIVDAGASATCLVCHQGRLSTIQVDETLQDMDDDAVSADLSFLNIHYRAAAASLYGGETRGGYEYAGKQYAARFEHPQPLNTCTGCHDPHALTVKADQCNTCHEGVTAETLATIRTGSPDYDGDGDTQSGVAAELATLHALLGTSISRYATKVAAQAVAYNASAYPYFFNDGNEDGMADDMESVFPNRYQSWTPRLLRAAYNYQFVAKDPGFYAHNPRYGVQLLVDSLQDLASQLDLDLPAMQRP